MKNITERFLKENTAPEVHDMLLETLDIIANIDEDICLEIDELIFSKVDTIPHYELLTMLRDRIEQVMFNILTRFGLTLNSEVNLRFMNQLFNIILQIENTDQQDFVKNIIDSEDDPREAFITIMDKVIGLDSSGLYAGIEDMYANIYRVSIGFITKIYNLTVPTLESYSDISVDTNKIAERLVRVVNMLDDRNLIVVSLIKSDPKLGLPFDAYMSIIGDEIFSTSEEDIIKNIYILAVMSEEGKQDIPTMLLEKLSTYNPDLSLNTRIIETARQYASMESNLNG